jgi:hypothetical protein
MHRVGQPDRSRWRPRLTTDLDPAFDACPTLADFRAADERFPDALEVAGCRWGFVLLMTEPPFVPTAGSHERLFRRARSGTVLDGDESGVDEVPERGRR